jgi:hypothetical protein
VILTKYYAGDEIRRKRRARFMTVTGEFCFGNINEETT